MGATNQPAVYRRSTTIAVAPPPPLQMEAQPSWPCFSRWISVTTMRAPDELQRPPQTPIAEREREHRSVACVAMRKRTIGARTQSGDPGRRRRRQC